MRSGGSDHSGSSGGSSDGDSSATMLATLAAQHHLHLTAAGLNAIRAEISAHGSGSAAAAAGRPPTAEEIVHCALNRHLRGVGAAILPVPPASGDSSADQLLRASAWLQLLSVRDVTAPLAHQRQGQRQGQEGQRQRGGPSGSASSAGGPPPRLLQLELTDGVTTLPAIEFVPLAAGDLSALQPGRKLLLRAGTVVRRGVLLLAPERITLPPRGGVESVALALAAQRSADAAREGPSAAAAGRPAAPSFRPFAQRELAQREAAWERQAAEGRMREQQRKEAAMRPMPPPPPQIEEAAGRRRAHAAAAAAAADPAAASAAVAASAAPISKAARAHTQIELENEFRLEAKTKATAAAAATAASASALPATRPHPAATSAATAAAPLSSFRTLLQAPLGSTARFSAAAADVQLFPPAAGQSAFALQLTLQDSFGLRAAAAASPTVFERFFWPQGEFAELMASHAGRARVQRRLADCRAKLCVPGHQWDVQLEVRPGTAAGAGTGSAAARSFVLVAIGDWVRGSTGKPAATAAKADQPSVAQTIVTPRTTAVPHSHSRGPRPSVLTTPLSLLSTVTLLLSVCLLLLLSAPSPASCARPSAFPSGSFMVGSSWRADLQRLDVLQRIGSSHARLYAHMAYSVAVLRDVEPALTVAAVDADFAQWAARLNAQADWTLMDRYIGTFVNSSGIVPIVELGEGTVQALPKFNLSEFRLRQAEAGIGATSGDAVGEWPVEAEAEVAAPLLKLLHEYAPKFFSSAGVDIDDGDNDSPADVSSDLDVFDPNLVGRACYQAYLYLFVRVFLSRYSGGQPFRYDLQLFQLENELNEAYLASLSGQRRLQLLGSVWAAADFQSELLGTLVRAVRLHVTGAFVTSNLHTDVPLAVHRALNLSGFYLESLADWRSAGLIDWVSFDSYPNMLCASPLQAAGALGQIVRGARAVVGPAAPIVVMETGYPSLAPGFSASNASAQWSEANQAAFAAEAFGAVRAAGGDGFLWFAVQQCAGMALNFTQSDYEFLALLGAVTAADAADGPVWALLQWALAHLSYVLSDFGRIVVQIGRSWGTNRADGSDRPVVDTLRQLFASVREQNRQAAAAAAAV